MAGFRLTDGSGGCPPTQTPPATYVNPFRLDDAGRLWLIDPLQFRYFGAARHDLPLAGTIGSEWVLPGAGLLVGPGIAGGTHNNLLVTNDTPSNMGIMLGLDVSAELAVRADNLLEWTLSSRWNGAHHSLCSFTNAQISGSTALVRQELGASANPHDLGFENGGTSAALQLAPGASATVGAQLFCRYAVGAATGTETVYSCTSAVRVYGYILA